MFTSLRARLWLSYALLILTALGVVALILFLHLLRNPFLYRQSLERLQTVQSILAGRETLLQTQSLPESAGRVSSLFGVRVVQVSRSGEVMLDVYGDEAPPLRVIPRRVLSRNIPLVRDETGATWVYSIEPLPDGTFLVVAAPQPRITVVNVFRNEFLPLIVQGGGIGLAVSLVLAFAFARWVGDPLQRILQAVGGLPAAEVRAVETGGPREVRELGRAFNAMVSRLDASQQAQRDFVANVSHELKTPLTSIQGFSQSILDGTADSPAQVRQAAQVIYDESGRMYRMALDLLDLARLDAGILDFTMAPVELQALLNAVVEKFEPQARSAGVQIHLEVRPGLPAVLGDGDRLSQVFINLVDNAVKFTPAGGIIGLRGYLQGDHVIVEVADTGPGIPAEALEHVFERFYQADRARRGGRRHGSGLGLVIAREITQLHGGRISVRSQAGRGTTFEVSLPLPADRQTTPVNRK